MKKNIYALLNDVETDFAEYENIELSPLEKEQFKKDALQEVLHRKREEKNVMKNRAWKRKAAAAACTAIILTAGGGTVLASGLFSETVERLIGAAQGTKYEQEDTIRYARIGKNTKSVDAKEGDYVTTAEDAGIKISVSDAVCDGYSLYFTATLTGDKERLNHADWIALNGSQNASPSVIAINGKKIRWSSKSFVKSAEDTYVMMGEIPNLFAEAELNNIQIKNGDVLQVEYMGEGIVGNDQDKHILNEKTGEYDYATVLDVTGDWHLKFPVTVDTSLNKTFTMNKENNGITVKEVTVTKTGLLVSLELPDMTQAPYNDPYNDPSIEFYDENGNVMQWLMGHAEYTGENGTGACQQKIMILYDGEQNLQMKVMDKNVEDRVIADIPFQIPAE